LLPALMRELLAGQPDAVVAIGPALGPAGAATRIVPVVAFGRDPIEFGLAATYARPGGNVTGVVILTGELEAKRLSILQETVPDRRRVAALVPASGAYEAVLRNAAAGLGVELLVFPAAAPSDYPAAFIAQIVKVHLHPDLRLILEQSDLVRRHLNRRVDRLGAVNVGWDTVAPILTGRRPNAISTFSMRASTPCHAVGLALPLSAWST